MGTEGNATGMTMLLRNRREDAEARLRKRKESARELANQLVAKLKARLPGHRITISTYDSDLDCMIAIVTAKRKRLQLIFETNKPWRSEYTERIRLAAGYGDGFTGCYRPKNGQLTEKQTEKIVARCVEFIEKLHADQAAETRQVDSRRNTFGAAKKTLTGAAYRLIDETSNKDEGRFGKGRRREDQFVLTVNGRSDGTARLTVGYSNAHHWCDLALLVDYADALFEHHLRMEALDRRNDELVNLRKKMDDKT